MLVPEQLIQVRINNKNQQHFKELGYDVSYGDTIIVPPEHLTKYSRAIVKVRCDIDGCNSIMDKYYYAYSEQHTYCLDVCKEHKGEKTKITNLIKYGTEWGFQNEEIKRKIEHTNIEKYGCENPSSAKKIRDKVKQTCLERYGVEHNSQVREFREKAVRTLAENSSVPTSSQQIKLYKIIKNKYPDAELNYPFSTCSLDIFVCVNSIKIDVEYDGGYWHQDKQKDIKRDKFLQSQGFKTLRIRSGHKVPTEEELFDAIDYLVNTEHNFKEIILSDWKEGDEPCRQLQVVV